MREKAQEYDVRVQRSDQERIRLEAEYRKTMQEKETTLQAKLASL